MTKTIYLDNGATTEIDPKVAKVINSAQYGNASSVHHIGQEAKIALEKATSKKEPALILITERLAIDLMAAIAKLNQRPELNIVLIPDNQGSTGLASHQIQQLVKNSIGAAVIIRK